MYKLYTNFSFCNLYFILKNTNIHNYIYIYRILIYSWTILKESILNSKKTKQILENWHEMNWDLFIKL